MKAAGKEAVSCPRALFFNKWHKLLVRDNLNIVRKNTDHQVDKSS